MKKFKYYVKNGFMTLLPTIWLQYRSKRLMAQKYDHNLVEERVNYYNKLSQPFKLDHTQATQVAQFKKTGGNTYFFDLYKVIKCFNPAWRFQYLNGDIINIPAQPCFLKSRPIEGNNENSVLLKLNAIRHYHFINDSLSFREKKDLLVWRGTGFRPNRRLLLTKFFDHPRCNIGRTDTQDADQLNFVVPKMTIKEQLHYKFILSLEGKDVATNLKWIMSSNSLCITPKLKYETWFMEGKLQAGVHYVEIKDDFSDLLEKMDYYLSHPKEAEQIIHNANAWIAPFKNERQEQLISQLVAKKYFELSDQSDR